MTFYEQACEYVRLRAELIAAKDVLLEARKKVEAIDSRLRDCSIALQKFVSTPNTDRRAAVVDTMVVQVEHPRGVTVIPVEKE